MMLAQASCSSDGPQQKSTSSSTSGTSSTAGSGSSSGSTGSGSGPTWDGGSTGAGGSGIINPNQPDGAAAPCGDAGTPWKIDLLFMIDNSSSMADKQEILAQAVPDLVNRFLDPVCVDPKTFVPVGTRLPDGSCAVGVPEFVPIRDLHIAIKAAGRSLTTTTAGTSLLATPTMPPCPRFSRRAS
jgi:hypothetical protein